MSVYKNESSKTCEYAPATQLIIPFRERNNKAQRQIAAIDAPIKVWKKP
ncbi:MAG: hypothetical protein HQL30_07585 [Candidatus Omnitrophica bacterium]|nr:hypothetical protein [Candidatus Omnitrophota bacterium]